MDECVQAFCRPLTDDQESHGKDVDRYRALRRRRRHAMMHVERCRYAALYALIQRLSPQQPPQGLSSICSSHISATGIGGAKFRWRQGDRCLACPCTTDRMAVADEIPRFSRRQSGDEVRSGERIPAKNCILAVRLCDEAAILQRRSFHLAGINCRRAETSCDASVSRYWCKILLTHEVRESR